MMKMKSSFLIGLGLYAAGAVMGQEKQTAKQPLSIAQQNERYDLSCRNGKVVNAVYSFPVRCGKDNSLILKDSAEYRWGNSDQLVSLGAKNPLIASYAEHALKMSAEYCKNKPDGQYTDIALRDDIRDDFSQMRTIMEKQPVQFALIVQHNQKLGL